MRLVSFEPLGSYLVNKLTGHFICSQLPISEEVFHLRHTLAKVNRTEWLDYFNQLFALVVSGQLVMPEPSAIFPIEDYKNALKAQEESGRQGKILFKILTSKGDSTDRNRCIYQRLLVSKGELGVLHKVKKT